METLLREMWQGWLYIGDIAQLVRRTMSGLSYAAPACVAAMSLVLYAPCLPARDHRQGQVDGTLLVRHHAHSKVYQPRGG